MRALLLSLLVLGGCASTTKAPDNDELFPMPRVPDGMRHIYRVTKLGAPYNLTFDGFYFERRSFGGRGLADAYNQYVNGGREKAIYFVVDGAVYAEWLGLLHGAEHYQPPIAILPAEPRPASWTWEGRYNRDPARATLTVVDRPEWRGHAGLHVREAHDGGVVIDRVFAAGVGLVRFVKRIDGEVVLELELIDFAETL